MRHFKLTHIFTNYSFSLSVKYDVRASMFPRLHISVTPVSPEQGC